LAQFYKFTSAIVLQCNNMHFILLHGWIKETNCEWDMRIFLRNINIVVTVQEITIGHFPTNFNIWLTKIHFGWPILLYIFNGMAINNLQNILSSKKQLTNF